MVTQSSIAVIAWLSLATPLQGAMNAPADDGQARWIVSNDATRATDGTVVVLAGKIFKDSKKMVANDGICVVGGQVIRAQSITVDLDLNTITLTHVGPPRTE